MIAGAGSRQDRDHGGTRALAARQRPRAAVADPRSHVHPQGGGGAVRARAPSASASSPRPRCSGTSTTRSRRRRSRPTTRTRTRSTATTRSCSAARATAPCSARPPPGSSPAPCSCAPSIRRSPTSTATSTRSSMRCSRSRARWRRTWSTATRCASSRAGSPGSPTSRRAAPATMPRRTPTSGCCGRSVRSPRSRPSLVDRRRVRRREGPTRARRVLRPGRARAARSCRSSPPLAAEQRGAVPGRAARRVPGHLGRADLAAVRRCSPGIRSWRSATPTSRSTAGAGASAENLAGVPGAVRRRAGSSRSRRAGATACASWMRRTRSSSRSWRAARVPVERLEPADGRDRPAGRGAVSGDAGGGGRGGRALAAGAPRRARSGRRAHRTAAKRTGALLLRARKTQPFFLAALREHGVPYHVLGIGGLHGRAGDRRPGERARGRRRSRARASSSSGCSPARAGGSACTTSTRSGRSRRGCATPTSGSSASRMTSSTVLRASVDRCRGRVDRRRARLRRDAPPEHVRTAGASARPGSPGCATRARCSQRLRRRTGLDLRDFVAFIVQELRLDIEVAANESRFARAGADSRRSSTRSTATSRSTPPRASTDSSPGSARRSSARTSRRARRTRSRARCRCSRSTAPRGSSGTRSPCRGSWSTSSRRGRRGQPRLAHVRRAAVAVPRRRGRPARSCSGSSVDDAQGLRDRGERVRQARCARIWTRRSGGSPTSRSPAPGDDLLLTRVVLGDDPEPAGAERVPARARRRGRDRVAADRLGAAREPARRQPRDVTWPLDPLGDRRTAVEAAAAVVARRRACVRRSRGPTISSCCSPSAAARRRRPGSSSCRRASRHPGSRTSSTNPRRSRRRCGARCRSGRTAPPSSARCSTPGSRSATAPATPRTSSTRCPPRPTSSTWRSTTPTLARLKATFERSPWAARRPVEVEREIHLPFVGRIVVCKIDAVYDAGNGPLRDRRLEDRQGARRTPRIAASRSSSSPSTGSRSPSGRASRSTASTPRSTSSPTTQILRPNELLDRAGLEALWQEHFGALPSSP